MFFLRFAVFVTALTLLGLPAFTQKQEKINLGRPVNQNQFTRTNVRNFSWRDLFKLKRASDIQISPDGKLLLYIRSIRDSITDRSSTSIWMLNIKTGLEHQWSKGTAYAPRWSPDGHLIAYTATGGNGNPRLFIGTIENSQGLIQDFPEHVENITWSPNGKDIAFTRFVPEAEPSIGISIPQAQGAQWAKPARIFTSKHIISDEQGEIQPGYTHLFTVSVGGGTAHQLTSGTYNDNGNPVWTPDGKYLYFSASREKEWDTDLYSEALYRVQVSNGDLKKMTAFPYAVGEPSVSPDGKTIAFIGTQKRKKDYEQGELFLINADGSNLRSLTSSLEREIGQLQWMPDGKAIIAVYDDHSITKMSRIGLDKSISVWAENLGGDAAFSISRDGAVAFPLSAANRPAEVALRKPTGGIRVLSHLNDTLFNDIDLGTVHQLKVNSSLDRKPLGAWLVFPADYDITKRYPLILSIHGGPHDNVGSRWSPEAQIYAAAGYVVLRVDYRGSTSYGYSFADLTYGNFPGPAYDDLISAVDAAIAQGVADSTRLFVTGGSAGGQLTAWIVGKTNRFKAAAAVKPVINELSKALVTDQYINGVYYSYPQTIWENPLAYWRNSPLSLADKVTTPTLLLVGENDRRTPVGESMQFYNALQLRNIPAALAIVPDASHSTLNARVSQLANNSFIILDWFKRYGGNPLPSK